jgi:hypothetical protein
MRFSGWTPDEIDYPMRDKTDRSLFSGNCPHRKSSAATTLTLYFFCNRWFLCFPARGTPYALSISALWRGCNGSRQEKAAPIRRNRHQYINEELIL